MPPFIPFPNGIEVVLEFRVSGQVVKNVLNFIASGTPTVTLMNALGKAIIDAVVGSTFFTTDFSSSGTFDDVKLTDMSSSTGPTTVVTHGTSATLPLNGGGSASNLTNNAALVVTQHTGNRGRSFRGRTYLANMTVASASSSVETLPATAANAVALITAIATAGLANGCTLAVFSRQNGGVPRTVGVATPVETLAANLAFDSQRRRLEGRGS